MAPVRRTGTGGQNGQVTIWQEWDGDSAMNGELPTIPRGEPPAGLWVPLARWWKPQGSMGYLLMVMLDPEPDDGLPYKADLDLFIRDENDQWRWSGGGGSDWRFGWAARPEGTGVRLEGMGTGGTGQPFVAPGVAGSEVTSVIVRGAGWECACPTNEQTGAFLIGSGLYERVELAAVDASGGEFVLVRDTTISDAIRRLK